MVNFFRASLVAAFLLPLAASAEPDPNSGSEFGTSVIGSVEVCKPKGEREYLARLVCPSGDRPTFQRSGSVGTRSPSEDLKEEDAEKLLLGSLGGAELKPGEADYHIVDGYDVACGETHTVVYLDMYHCSGPAPTRAPQGFTLVDKL